jgi:hypothetical protein
MVRHDRYRTVTSDRYAIVTLDELELILKCNAYHYRFS